MKDVEPRLLTTSAIPRAYEKLRTARMNAIYYGSVLSSFQRLNFGMEIAIALGTSGTLASLALFNTTGGKVLLAGLAAIATLLSVVKPVLNLTKKVERYSALWCSYTAQANALRRIANEIAENHGMTVDVSKRLESCCEQMDSLSDDPAPKKDLIEQAFEQVNAEIPYDSLWWPPEEFDTEATPKTSKTAAAA